MSHIPNIVISLELIYGPVLIATFIATFFAGIAILQTLVYFASYNSDGRSLKCLVLVLSSLNALHAALCIQVLFQALVGDFGTSSLSRLPPALLWQIAVMGIVAAIAQGFFTWRIWCFSKRKLFLITLSPLIIGQMVLSLVFGTSPTTARPLPQTKLPLPLILIALYAIFSFTDIFIAIIMVILLKKSRTGLLSTDKLILRLINVSVSTGAITALFAVAGLIIVLVFPVNLSTFIGQIPLPSLYCNTVLANLNSRKYLRGVDVLVEAPSDIGLSIHIGSLPTPSESRNPNTGSARDK